MSKRVTLIDLNAKSPVLAYSKTYESPTKVRTKPAKHIAKPTGSKNKILIPNDNLGFSPSAYQSGIREFLLSSDQSALIDAKAGAGKTSTMEWIAEQLVQRINGKRQFVLMLAFNRDIADELKSRMPSWIKCATFHSVGYGTWIRHVKQKIQIKNDKVRKILKEKLSEADFRSFGSICTKLVGFGKNAGIGTYIRRDTDSNWSYLIYHHCLDIGSDETRSLDERKALVIKHSQDALIESNKMRTVIDFDDMLYLPLLEQCYFFRNNLIFVDEAQDTNPVQIALLKRMLKKEGRLIAVGDGDQAIYGFRGAGCDAISMMVEKFNMKVLPLSICYRCDKNIVIEAQRIVPGIESFDRNADGVVETVLSYSSDDFSSGDAILCRNTAPLIKFAYQLIGRGKAANVMGRDIGSGLIRLIESLDATDLSDLTEKLADWTDKQVSRLSKEDGSDAAIGAIMDKSECIKIFMENVSGTFTIKALCDSIATLFSDDAPDGVLLGTSHRSKGREWDRVYVLDRHLMPSKWARIAWMQRQEANLEYVTITRAKHYLGYINSSCWND